MIEDDQPLLEPAPDVLMTRAELIAQLPLMSMSDSMSLTAIEPDGSEHPANVGYSSDLKAFAIMTYDDNRNITSWYPLPTKTIHHNYGYDSDSSIKHAEQLGGGDSVDRSNQTLFKFVTPPNGE